MNQIRLVLRRVGAFLMAAPGYVKAALVVGLVGSTVLSFSGVASATTMSQVTTDPTNGFAAALFGSVVNWVTNYGLTGIIALVVMFAALRLVPRLYHLGLRFFGR